MSVPVAKVIEVSKYVRSKFARILQPADRDDIEQEAALAALATAKRYKLRVGVNPFSFLATAAFREAALVAARKRSQFSFSERARKEGKVPEDKRVRLEGPNEPAGGELPDARVRAREEESAVQALRVQLRARLERIVLRFDGAERRAAAMLLGLDDEGAEPQEVVWRTGMTSPAVAKVVAKLTDEVRGDPEARRLRGVISALG